MAGSSCGHVAETARELPLPCDLVDAVAIGYGPYEGMAFTAVEALQSMVERRRGGESASGRCRTWRRGKCGRPSTPDRWSKRCLSGDGVVPAHAKATCVALRRAGRRRDAN